ncbi:MULTISPECIES: DNA-3-methyladenine glycosylase family protein [Fictibacillus]|jgi:DNA-3-methyladenine glycosylase II|uniref:DNA-3-methyladenine glycosylase family protein n=1 Tax=Fictibacillus TaxID=1329200 RepID=UPI00102A13DB|nr:MULTISPECIES: DNA-3-methyladenine glycosylase [Fictibacillus]RZT23875.1 DNA-3-methyladenine glycosylase II [Fictibacillus sp. BK138]
MQWSDHGGYLKLQLPEEFSFNECLVFLGRSELELLHHIEDKHLMKLVRINDEEVLLKISSEDGSLIVEFCLGAPAYAIKEQAVKYISEWFDIERNLSGFYEMAYQDKILRPLAIKYYGLRMIGIPDLFEAITWAIMGQQINLKFAYTLKKRLIEHFGEKRDYENTSYWLYPTPEKIAVLHIDELRKLQFTSRKAEYVIGAAKEMASGRLTKEMLMVIPDLKKQHETLLSLKGVGAWTADYVMMKCLLETTAFPVADVGLHNSLKEQLNLASKPKQDEIIELAQNWSGWEAYATFYLWRSLYE